VEAVKIGRCSCPVAAAVLALVTEMQCNGLRLHTRALSLHVISHYRPNYYLQICSPLPSPNSFLQLGGKKRETAISLYLSDIFNNHFTPWSRFLLGNLLVARLADNYSSLCDAQRRTHNVFASYAVLNGKLKTTFRMVAVTSCSASHRTNFLYFFTQKIKELERSETSHIFTTPYGVPHRKTWVCWTWCLTTMSVSNIVQLRWQMSAECGWSDGGMYWLGKTEVLGGCATLCTEIPRWICLD